MQGHAQRRGHDLRLRCDHGDAIEWRCTRTLFPDLDEGGLEYRCNDHRSGAFIGFPWLSLFMRNQQRTNSNRNEDLAERKIFWTSLNSVRARARPKLSLRALFVAELSSPDSCNYTTRCLGRLVESRILRNSDIAQCLNMASRSPSRGRSRTRSRTPTIVQHSKEPQEIPRSVSRSRSRGRSLTPKSRSYSGSPSRSPSHTPGARDRRNGDRNGEDRSRSPSRASGDGRRYRERSYSRSASRESAAPQSSKIVVEKLTKNVTEAHLREIFGSYGQIESIDLPLNRQCKLQVPMLPRLS